MTEAMAVGSAAALTPSRTAPSRRPDDSNIDLDGVPAQLHQLAPRMRLALAHQARERALRLGDIELAQFDAQQPARLRVQGGLPQMLGVHLAQPLEAADLPRGLARAFLAQLVQRGFELAIVQRV